jgi:hypothetical protein
MANHSPPSPSYGATHYQGYAKVQEKAYGALWNLAENNDINQLKLVAG